MKRLMLPMVFISLCAAVPVALARGDGGGAAHGATAHPVGPSARSAAAANSNGRFSSDRDHGLDRAADRRHPKSSRKLADRKSSKPAEKIAARKPQPAEPELVFREPPKVKPVLEPVIPPPGMFSSR